MRAELLGGVLLVTACGPGLGPPSSLITELRILGLRAEPPEVRPGGLVTLSALVASPAGTVEGAALGWAWCLAPKPVSEDNVVAAACLGGVVAALGEGSTISAPVPADACARFGPDVPPPQEGEAPRRPRDPDSTGGYYQPVRARLGDQVAFGLVRVLCGLAAAPADVAADYRARYVENRAPRLRSLTTGDERPDPRAEVRLDAGWGPDDAEPYVAYDSASQALRERREALRVSWFTSAGSLAAARTGRTEDDPATGADTRWSAPAEPGAAHLWAVLRDSRGGIDWAALDVTF